MKAALFLLLFVSSLSYASIGKLVKEYTDKVPIPVNTVALDCLTNALFKEAEVKVTENDLSMIMIADVVMNRVGHKRFPSSVCGVIKQKLNGYCIFSFYCLRGHDHMPDKRRYRIAREVAYRALQGHYKGISASSLFYKRCEVKDKWFAKNTIFLKRIRSHCFYTYRR